MDESAALAYAEHVGSFFASKWAVPPLTGRTLGWLLVCDPPHQTAAQLAEALHASRAGISASVAMLESMGYVRRRRRAGERVDLFEVDTAAWSGGFDQGEQFKELARLANEGLVVLADADFSRRARLTELAAFAEFLSSRIPALLAEWRDRRAGVLEVCDEPMG